MLFQYLSELKYFSFLEPSFEQWASWTKCPVSCGSTSAVKIRTRKCQGGCDDEKEDQDCGRLPCPGENFYNVHELNRLNLLDTNSSEKIEENLPWWRKFCPTNFCTIRYYPKSWHIFYMIYTGWWNFLIICFCRYPGKPGNHATSFKQILKISIFSWSWSEKVFLLIFTPVLKVPLVSKNWAGKYSWYDR